MPAHKGSANNAALRHGRQKRFFHVSHGNLFGTPCIFKHLDIKRQHGCYFLVDKNRTDNNRARAHTHIAKPVFSHDAQKSLEIRTAPVPMVLHELHVVAAKEVFE